MALFDHRVFRFNGDWWVGQVHSASGAGWGDGDPAISREQVYFSNITNRETESKRASISPGLLNRLSHGSLIALLDGARPHGSYFRMAAYNAPSIEELGPPIHVDGEGLRWATQPTSMIAVSTPDLVEHREGVRFICLDDSALQKDVLMPSGTQPVGTPAVLEQICEAIKASYVEADPAERRVLQRLSRSTDVWLEEHRRRGRDALTARGLKGFVEYSFRIKNSPLHKTGSELLRAMQASVIHAFGWPLGVVLERADAAPKPTADGIVAEVPVREDSYDYWSLSKTGQFYLIQSLFEDARRPDENVLFFDTRIVRTTELVMLASRLYGALGLAEETEVTLSVEYQGLRGRILETADPKRLMFPRRTQEDSLYTELSLSKKDIGLDLSAQVRHFTQPLFELFEFFELSDAVHTQVVEGYRAEVAKRG